MPTTVVFKLKFATTTFLPSLADPYAFIYPKAILDKDPHWFEQHVMGSGPFKFVTYDIGQSIKGERNPDYYHKGLPYLDGFVGIFAPKQAVRVEAIRSGRAAMEFRGLPPGRDQRPQAGTRRQDQGADQRLELRQPDHAQRTTQAVRRCARAQGAAAGDRPVERRAGAVEDRQRAHRRRHRVPRLAAGRDQGGTAEDGRVLARHREVARRGPASAEGGRPGEPARSNCSTATSISRTSTSAPGWSISGARSA